MTKINGVGGPAIGVADALDPGEGAPILTVHVVNPGEAIPTECPQCYRFNHEMPADERPGVPPHHDLHVGTEDGSCWAQNNAPGAPPTCTCPFRPRGA